MSDPKNLKQHPSFEMLGNAAGPGGSLMVIRGLDGAGEMIKAVLRAELQKVGLPITIGTEMLIAKMASEHLSRMETAIRSRGVPQGLHELLRAPTKRAAEKAATGLRITLNDFTALIFNCAQAGYTHQQKQHEFVPDQLWPSDDEKQAVLTNGPGPMSPKASKFFRKVKATFEQRRYVVAHLFERDQEWHCFYFTLKDAFDGLREGENHWREGTHIHYVAHHWTDLSRDMVWNALDGKRTNFPSLHIRFMHDKPDR